ncbi:MAG: V0D/AC39 family V-type ATPase subunit [Brevinemataceae bacterium]
MTSFQYIPLSVRVRSWNLSLLKNNEIEDLLNDDLSVLYSKISAKEKNAKLDTSDSATFLYTFKSSLFEYGRIAMSLSNGSGRLFIKELLKEFEIENLKILVRALLSKNFRPHFNEIDFVSHFTVKQLSEIHSFTELQHLLEGTEYYSLYPSLQKTQQEKNTLYWETVLDNFYVSRISSASKGLDMSSRRAIRHLVLTSLQFERLVLLFRYRYHYHIEPIEALQYIPNLTHIMSNEDWSRFAFASTGADFLYYLGALKLIPLDLPEDSSAIRSALRKKIEFSCRKTLHADLSSLSSFVAFIQLKKIQYHKISTVIAVKSFQIDKSDVMQFL